MVIILITLTPERFTVNRGEPEHDRGRQLALLAPFCLTTLGETTGQADGFLAPTRAIQSHSPAWVRRKVFSPPKGVTRVMQ
jgi:hypothetical protein